MYDLVISTSGQQLREVLKGLLEQLINETYDEDVEMTEYLVCDIDDFIVEMRNAVENDVMQQVIIL